MNDKAINYEIKILFSLIANTSTEVEIKNNVIFLFIRNPFKS